MPQPSVFDDFPESLRCDFGPYMGVLDQWHDADTCKVQLSPGWDETPCRWIRLLGVGAPELYQAGGIATRDFAASLVPPGTPVRVTSFKMPRTGGQTMSFSRYVATIEVESGADVAAEINRFVAENGYSTGS